MQALGSCESQTTSSEAFTTASNTSMRATMSVMEGSPAANTESSDAMCLTSKGGLWQEFDTRVMTSQSNRTTNTDAYIEMCRYMEEKVIPRNEDPLL